MGSLILALLGACAGLDEPEVDPDPPAQTKQITMGLISDVPPLVAGSSSAGFGWELTVDPTEISSGEPFAAELSGKVIFDERFLAEGQRIFGGHKFVILVDLRATVRVRDGAVGDPEVLTPELIPYLCMMSKTACDPENDVLDDPPKLPSLRGNTDCEPQGEDNPCGRFVEIPTSDDCAPGGVCDELGHVGSGSQCAVNGFCVSGPMEVALEKRVPGYVADESGSVLFGFDDSADTLFGRLEEGGCNDGTWYGENPAFEDPLGSNGVRMIANGEKLAFEFVMGEDSNGPEGIDSCDPLSSPSPDSSLIKFPIL
jgi:hypothetical protein